MILSESNLCRGDLSQLSAEVLREAGRQQMRIALAESCTGGSISKSLASVEGLSHVFEAAFIVYSDSAKATLLKIPPEEIARFGAVSRPISIKMAEQALRLSAADVAMSITGFTGPKGTPQNGLVHMAVTDFSNRLIHREYHFGEVDRERGCALASANGLKLLFSFLTQA